jgi:hypothetical protein
VHLAFSAKNFKKGFVNDFFRKDENSLEIHNLLILAPKIMKQIL